MANLGASLALCAVLLCGGLVAYAVLPRNAGAPTAAPASGVAAQAAPPSGLPLPDGTLAKASGDPRVFLLEAGAKRWIPSAEVFTALGFRWEQIVTVPAADLTRHGDGEPLHAASRVVLPGEERGVPDLMPFPAQDMRLAVEGGRTMLRFTSAFWNAGPGTMELVADGVEAGDERLRTMQRIVRSNGSVRDKTVGYILWHAVHDHYHYEDFADYVLERIGPETGDVAPASVTQKTTFCLRDDRAIASGAPRAFAACGKTRQGVSVGWADVYRSTLPDQRIDVHDLPAGIYRLTFTVDPRRNFTEARHDNNVSVAVFEMDPRARRLGIIATGANFATGENRYREGMLVRRIGRPEVFVVQGNRKRLLRTAELLTAYRPVSGGIYDLPSGVVDAIPPETFIRAAGTSEVFMVNEAGHKRRIIDPAALRAYGVEQAVVTVTAEELASYPDTDLVKRADDDRVYSVTDKRYVGRFAALADVGRDPRAVQTVHDVDFSSYAVKTVVSGLEVPWDIVFLPDGDMLVTERTGAVRRIGAHPATITIPGVRRIGEGGLMGIALHPDFMDNRFVYLYFTTAEEGTKNRVVRFRLEGDRLIEDRVILDGIPAALYHDGGQLAFGPDGMLYVTTGDANAPDAAQVLSSLAGKTLRLTPDGGIPEDNPFGSAVWSFGHRNAQGIAWDAAGRMWQTEHGRSGALSGLDELNRVEQGKNYGWPTSQGDVSGTGMTPPVRHSGPDVTWAPSGIAFVDGRLFFAGLRGAALYETTVTETGGLSPVVAHLAGAYGRLRAVVRGPDGFLYVTTSNRDGRGTPRTGDDRILRIHPDFLVAP